MQVSSHSSFTAVIIGGNGAGLSAASKIKRLRPSARVLVFEKGPHVSYANCGIPFWLAGDVPQNNLILLSPETLQQKRGIDVFPRHEVIAIDRRAGAVQVRHCETLREFKVAYDRLLIATGARPRLPDWAIAEAENVFTLRDLQSGQALKQALSGSLNRIAVLGGGYLGLEMAMVFRRRGLETVVLEQAARILPGFHEAISAHVQAYLERQGVTVITGLQPGEPRYQGPRLQSVRLSPEGRNIQADGFFMATGIVPNVELAQTAGLQLGSSGAIAVDDTLRTSDPRIFAAGDCIEVRHRMTDEPVWLPFGPAANKQGRIAGANMAGERQRYAGALGTSAVTIGELEVARTGLTLPEAQRRFNPVEHVFVQTQDIAGYMPGEKQATVVLIFRKRDGRLLGAEMAGFHGIGKRIDVLATALQAGLDVRQLAELDLSYTPTIAPVWDPILIAANAAVKKLSV